VYKRCAAGKEDARAQRRAPSPAAVQPQTSQARQRRYARVHNARLQRQPPFLQRPDIRRQLSACPGEQRDSQQDHRSGKGAVAARSVALPELPREESAIVTSKRR